MAKAPEKVELTAEQKETTKAARAAAKTEAFIKLAPKRIQKAIDAIANLNNLANKNSYGYSAEQVEKMKSALETQLSTTLARFAADAKEEAATGFAF